MKISRRHKIATLGSRFAEEMSRHLRDGGFTVLVTEDGHPMLDDAERARFHYGPCTTRCGNVDSSRHLLQLFQRALGRFQPRDDCWREGTRLIDPYRPTVQPGGFSSEREFAADRGQHLAAVARAMLELDVLMLALGATDVWVNRADGAAYPQCPGVAGGTFDPSRHALVKLTVEEIVADVAAAVDLLRDVNPAARVVLVEGPANDAQTVLRQAAERLTGTVPRFHYFASMALVFQHATDAPTEPRLPASAPSDDYLRRAQQVVDVMCEEEVLDRFSPDNRA